MKIDLNKLSNLAYNIACEHGFHDEEHSDEHYLMLVITEISEAVNADRKNNHADVEHFNKMLDTEIIHWKTAFERCIKDSVEDEFADIIIRLLDFARVINMNIDISYNINYSKEYFDSFSFIEASYNLVQIIIDNNIIKELMEENTIYLALSFVIQWCKYLNIDLFQHIEWKMRYNELRPYKNDKKY